MPDSIKTAFDSIVLAILGGVLVVVGLCVAWVKVWLTNRIESEKAKSKSDQSASLLAAIQGAGAIGVMSAAQLTEGKRSEAGNLPPAVAATAKKSAVETVKTLLSPEQLEQAKGQFGPDGQLDRALHDIIEAELYKMRGAKTSTTSEISTAKKEPDGSVTTSKIQESTTTGEPSKPDPT